MINILLYFIIFFFFFQVDGKGVQGESPGSARLFTEVPQRMYFGGLPGEHEFIDTTNDDFDGCIDHIVMSSVAVDLSKSTETLSTAPGCPVKVTITGNSIILIIV